MALRFHPRKITRSEQGDGGVDAAGKAHQPFAAEAGLDVEEIPCRDPVAPFRKKGLADYYESVIAGHCACQEPSYGLC